MNFLFRLASLVSVAALRLFPYPSLSKTCVFTRDSAGSFFGPTIPTPGAGVNVPAPVPAPVPEPVPEPSSEPAPAPSGDEGSSDTPNVVTAEEQEAQEGRGSAN